MKDPIRTRPTIYERIGQWLGERITTHAGKTIVLSMLVFAVLALGVGRAAFSTDYRVFFSKDDPGLATFERLERVFTKTDNILFVVKANEGSVFRRDSLEAIEELTREAWKLPWATRVDSLTSFPMVEAAGDDIAQHPLLAKPARDLDAAELGQMERTAMAETLLVGSLVSRDAKTGAVNVMIRLPGLAPEEVTRAATAARALASDVARRHPSVDVRTSGMALINDAFMQASVRDLGLLMPIMVIVMLATMFFALRSAAATAAVATVIFVSAALAMAVAGWFRYPLTPPTIAAPIMVLTVAVADGVHIVLAVMENIREGMAKRAAIVSSLRTNLEAVTYTWLTTVVGFACLNYSDAPPVRHLANMTSFGVTFAFVFSIVLLPALLMKLPVHAARRVSERSSAVTDRLARFVMRHRMAVLGVSAVLAGGSAVLASRLETNDQFVQYFDSSIEFRRDADFTMKNLSGIYRLELQVGSGAAGGVLGPEYLQRLDELATWLRSQPEVDHVYAFSDVMKHVHRAVHGGDPSAYAVPATREDAAEALFLYEMGLPQGADLKDRVDVDRTTTRVSVTVKDMSTRDMTSFQARAKEWLETHAPRAMWADVTGPVVIFSEMSARNVRGMVQGDFLSLALISLCMMLVLRSGRMGLLSVVPNVVPILVGYGVWKLLGLHMNVVASVAASISLGVIVDDTIHFLTKYKAVSAKEPRADVAMQRTLAAVAPAMLSTSAILALGFAVLTLSAFQMTSHLGWLSVVIVGVAPLADLVLVPALVLTFVKKSAGDPAALVLSPENISAGASS